MYVCCVDRVVELGYVCVVVSSPMGEYVEVLETNYNSVGKENTGKGRDSWGGGILR